LLSLPVMTRRTAARAMAQRYPWSSTVTSLLDRYADATQLSAW
jgi:hypothetical protein